ncbi:hypothetical protein ABIB81_008832 [Bradyrhizobium sp. I1.7.5]
MRNGARALLAKAVEAEVADFLGQHADLKTADGHRRVVRHGPAGARGDDRYRSGRRPPAACTRSQGRRCRSCHRSRRVQSIPQYVARAKALKIVYFSLFSGGVLRSFAAGDASSPTAEISVQIDELPLVLNGINIPGSRTFSSVHAKSSNVHCVVPGGGLSPDSARWIASRPNFFLAAKPLARLTFTIPACTALARPIMEELSFGLLQTFAINVIHCSPI